MLRIDDYVRIRPKTDCGNSNLLRIKQSTGAIGIVRKATMNMWWIEFSGCFGRFDTHELEKVNIDELASADE